MVSLAASLAVLAAAIGGGSYQGHVDAPCDRTCVAYLTVVSDGRSLAADSIVAAPCQPAGTSSSFGSSSPRGTPVHSDGSFRWRGREQVVEGRFSSDGRTVTGSSRFLGRARTDCSSATTRFTATLAHRAKPDGTCEPLSKGRLQVSVFVRRTGCTRATRVVDAWRADPDCVTGSAVVGSCRVAGHRCGAVSGGRLRSLAGAACRAGRSRIELVIRQACGGPGPIRGYTSRAINVGCDVAAAVARLWSRQQACGRRSCTVASWRCGPPTGTPLTTHCRLAHAAVEIRREILIED